MVNGRVSHLRNQRATTAHTATLHITKLEAEQVACAGPNQHPTAGREVSRAQ